jgi:hypothetical protein
MHSEIILIGPMRAGKSTLAQLLAEKLGIPRVSMDDGAVVGKYFEEAGFDADVARQFQQNDDPLGYARYVWPFFPHVLMRLLAEHQDCVIDLGAGHSVYEDDVAFGRVQQALAPYRNVVLVLPSPDVERSAAVLRERTADVEWLRQVREQHGIDFNEQFLRHPSNYQLARIVVYTEGKSPEETRDEILRRVRMGREAGPAPEPPSGRRIHLAKKRRAACRKETNGKTGLAPVPFKSGKAPGSRRLEPPGCTVKHPRERPCRSPLQRGLSGVDRRFSAGPVTTPPLRPCPPDGWLPGSLHFSFCEISFAKFNQTREKLYLL